MKLPYGTPVKSDGLPKALNEIIATLEKNAFTGYLRASLISKPGESVEGVLVFKAGTPAIAFTSDGNTDRPDNDLQLITSIVSRETAILELCAFNESQIRLMMDFCKEFILKAPAPVPKPAPQPAQQPAIKPKPQAEPAQPRHPRAESHVKQGRLPEVRGQFVKSETVESLGAYLATRTDETGHVIFAIRSGDTFAEYHILLIRGKPEAAYSEKSDLIGKPLLDSLMESAGDAEFYRVEESIIISVIHGNPRVSTSPAPEPTPRSEPGPRLDPPGPRLEPPRRTNPVPVSKPEPAPVPEAKPWTMPVRRAEPPQQMPENIQRHEMGIPARALLERSDRQAYSVEGLGTPVPEVKSTSTMKGDMDADIDFVKKVESEFVGNVDELLKRLELSHLKVTSDNKKKN
jgi:hypothetical protein